MVRFRAVVASFMLMPLLSGCALFKWPSRANIAIRVPDQPSVNGYGPEQIEQGRKMLDEGKYGLAIIAFSNAQHLTECAAAAHNGLGVAYAHLGRRDLAERYFRQAMLEAPGDRRYQANLARFYDTAPTLANVDSSELVARAEASRFQVQPLVNAAGKAILRIELPAARTERISTNEVRIYSAPVEVRRRSQPVRVALSSASSAEPRRNQAYPIRIQLRRGTESGIP